MSFLQHVHRTSVEWITLLIRIREVSGSNLQPKTAMLTEILCSIPQYLQENAARVS
jgi:hypothetical protein